MVRIQIAGWLYKVWNLARVKVGKKANDLRSICIVFLDRKIRTMNGNFLIYGKRVEDDALIGYIINKLIMTPCSEAQFDAALERQSLTGKLIIQCEQNSDIQRVLAIYFSSLAFIHNILGNEADGEKYTALSAHHMPSFAPLQPKDIQKQYRKIVKQTRAIYNEVAERSAIKFSPSAASITSGFGIVSGVMIVAGIIYTSTLLGSIGIKTSLFFSISDYLSTALDQIRLAMVSVALSVGMVFMEFRSASIQLPRTRTSKRANIERAFYLAIILSLMASVAFHAWKGEVDRDGIVALGTIFAYKVSNKLCNWFFRPNAITFIYISAILVFTANTTGSLLKEINDIKKGKWESREKITIVPKPDSKIKTATLILIDANSNYLFAIDKNSHIATVIPKDQIAEFEIK
ncbi:hypothetical protein [Paraburkholderia sp. GAS41]|uniref:hypothetical protein n=1 Tax=Paraburkholderia sp. GAS41 TaxID=3035134 RepID=UPI003D202F7A